jgi:hypothetical protein
MTWLACSSGLWPFRLLDSSNGWHRTCFSFVPFLDDWRAQMVANEGNEESSKIASLLFTNIIAWLSISGFYGRLARLQCVIRSACGSFLHSRFILLVAHEFVKFCLRGLRSRICIYVDLQLYFGGWFCNRNIREVADYLRCRWTADPGSVLERAMFTCRALCSLAYRRSVHAPAWGFTIVLLRLPQMMTPSPYDR